MYCSSEIEWHELAVLSLYLLVFVESSGFGVPAVVQQSDRR